MTEPSQPNFAAQREVTLIVIATLVVLSAIGNYYGTIFCSNLFSFEELICTASGLLIAQPCLLSIWCVLGIQNWAIRIPLSMGLLSGEFCFYIVALNSDSAPFPSEAIIAIAAGTIVILFFVQLPLLIFRYSKQLVIQLHGSRSTASQFQFSIKHLMVTTTIAAVLFWLIQMTIPASSFRSMGSVPWGEVITFLAAWIILISLTTFVSLACVFSKLSRTISIAWLACMILVGSFTVCAFLEFISGHPVILDGYFNTVLFTTSLSATIIAALSIFHGIGYRLQSNTDS